MEFLGETALAELWNLIKAEDAKGAKIAAGSYIGTGNYGSGNPNILTFDFVPKIVIVQSQTGTQDIILIAVNGTTRTAVLPALAAVSSQVSTVLVTWNGKQMRWYGEQNASAGSQLNSYNIVYNYIAIG